MRLRDRPLRSRCPRAHAELRALGRYGLAPLAESWEGRLAVHQICPLLVHACVFGGGTAPARPPGLAATY